MSQRYEYKIVRASGIQETGQLVHRIDRSPASWGLDDLKGLFFRMRDLASGATLAPGEEIFVEMKNTVGVGMMISVGVRGDIVTLQLREQLRQDVVEAWHEQQHGQIWTSRFLGGA